MVTFRFLQRNKRLGRWAQQNKLNIIMGHHSMEEEEEEERNWRCSNSNSHRYMDHELDHELDHEFALPNDPR